jgi:TRAP-type C4-dicarboxylate transport system permease small subunit
MRIAISLLSALTVALMTGLIVVPVAQVIMRGVFTLPFIGAEELTRFLLICVVFASYPLVIQSGENIVMGEIKNALPKALRRAIDLAISIAAVGICLFIGFVTLTNISGNLNNATPTLGIPFWIFLAATFFGFTGAAIVHLIHLRHPPQADTNVAI